MSLLTLTAVRARSQAATPERRAGPLAQLSQGVAAITSSPEITMLIVIFMGSTLLYGQELVLLVLVSEDLLETGSQGVSLLFAAIGVGGVVAAGLSGRVAASANAGRLLLIAALLSGASLIALSVIRTPVLAYGVMTLDGAGAVILDVVAVTMLQGIVAPEVMGRVKGAKIPITCLTW